MTRKWTKVATVDDAELDEFLAAKGRTRADLNREVHQLVASLRQDGYVVEVKYDRYGRAAAVRVTDWLGDPLADPTPY